MSDRIHESIQRDLDYAELEEVLDRWVESSEGIDWQRIDQRGKDIREKDNKTILMLLNRRRVHLCQ